MESVFIVGERSESDGQHILEQLRANVTVILDLVRVSVGVNIWIS